MKVNIDIENAHTQEVVTYECPVLEFNEKGEIKFDISSLSNSEVETLKLAISESPDLSYTDIEMFFLEDDEIPYFGPDYNFRMEGNILIGKYNREIKSKKEKNKEQS